jgi:membrane protein EpsK
MNILRKLPFLKNTSIKYQVFINTVSNVALYGLTILISLWYTPYLLNHLGVELYGLIPIATQLPNYLGLITLGITAGVGRYLTVDLEQGNIDSANKVFNTSLFGLLRLSFFVLIVGLLIVVLVPLIFNIPTGSERSAQLLFLAVVFAFLITTYGTSFMVSTFVKNRLDLRNIIRIIEQFVRIGIVVLFFSFVSPRIEIVGLGIFLGAAFIFGGDILLWKKLTPDLSIRISDFDKSQLRRLFSFGGWQVINIVGSLFFLNCDVIILNIFVSAEAAGKYGSILLFSIALRTMVNVVANGISPYLVKRFAVGDMATINKVSLMMTKYTGLFIGIASGIFCGIASSLLVIWLGKDFSDMATIFFIMMVHLPINLAVVPLFDVQMTLAKVKIPGILTLILGVVNILVEILFAKMFGLLGVAIASALILTMKNAIFTPIYAARIQKLPFYVFLKAMIPGIIIAGICLAFALLFNQIFTVNSWLMLMLEILVVGIIGIIISAIFFVDKQLLRRILPGA